MSSTVENPQEKVTISPSENKKAKRSDSDRNILIAAKGGGITFVSQLVIYISSFVFSIVVARFLGAEQYGLYKLSIAIITIVIPLCFLGLNGGVARYLPIARIEGDKAKIWGIIQIGTGIPGIIGLVVAFIFLLFAEPLLNQFIGKPALVPVLRLAILAIPIRVLSKCLSAIAQGFKQVQYIAYKDMAFNLLKLVLSITVLLLGFGVMELIMAFVASSAVAMVMILYYVHRLFPLKRALNSAKRNIRELLNFSLPLYLQRLLNQYGRNLETLVLGYFGVLAEVGIFAAILTLSAVGNMAFASLRQISAPIISELHSQGKIGELKRFYQTTTKWAFAFNLPVFLTMVLFGESMLSIWGKEFTAGATGLILLAAGQLFNVTTGTCGTVINMSGYSKLGLVNSIVYLATTIFFDFLLIPKWFLVGAALAGTLTIMINNSLRLVEVYFLINRLLPFNWSFLKPISASLMAGGVAYFLLSYVLVDQPIFQLLLLVPFMWMIYIGAIMALGLSKEDRMILRKLRHRKKSKKK